MKKKKKKNGNLKTERNNENKEKNKIEEFCYAKTTNLPKVCPRLTPSS